MTLCSNISWNQYIGKIKSKSNILSNIIIKLFSPQNTHLLVELYKTYIRPITEYNTCTWSPYLQKDIKEAESTQRSFTRRLCKRANIKYNDYNDRLNILGLESLKSRRVKNDLIMLYKIIYKLVDVDFDLMFKFSSFGGHNLRRHRLCVNSAAVYKSTLCAHLYANRVIPYWNSLPENVIASNTLTIFKFNLQSLNFDFD